jgi:hypothetical protein
MADRKTEIVEAMQNLARKASELAVEHGNTIQEYQRLKTELENDQTQRSSPKTKQDGPKSERARKCRSGPQNQLLLSPCTFGMPSLRMLNCVHRQFNAGPDADLVKDPS